MRAIFAPIDEGGRLHFTDNGFGFGVLNFQHFTAHQVGDEIFKLAVIHAFFFLFVPPHSPGQFFHQFQPFARAKNFAAFVALAGYPQVCINGVQIGGVDLLPSIKLRQRFDDHIQQQRARRQILQVVNALNFFPICGYVGFAANFVQVGFDPAVVEFFQVNDLRARPLPQHTIQRGFSF